MMTCKELIEKLKEFPEDAPVFVCDDCADKELDAEDIKLVPATSDDPRLQQYAQDWVSLEAKADANTADYLLGKES